MDRSVPAKDTDKAIAAAQSSGFSLGGGLSLLFVPDGGCSRYGAAARTSAGYSVSLGSWSVQKLLLGIIRSESQLDQSAGIGRNFALPAIVSLELFHRRLRACVPFAARFARKVVLANQGVLDLPGPFWRDLLLAVALP